MEPMELLHAAVGLRNGPLVKVGRKIRATRGESWEAGKE